MTFILKYKNLGRRKVSGEAVVKDLTFEELNKVFSSFFMSMLDFDINDKTGEGRINYGWYSAPFTFKKINKKPAHNVKKSHKTERKVSR